MNAFGWAVSGAGVGQTVLNGATQTGMKLKVNQITLIEIQR